MRGPLSDPDRRRALDVFVRGLLALEQAERGDASAAEEAIRHLHVCLEWVTPQTWRSLWVEAQIAKADAYTLRRRGDPLENARTALACYRAALCTMQDDVWQWAGEPLPAENGSGYRDVSEP